MSDNEDFEPTGIHIQSITVSRQLNEDGIETYSVEYNGDVGWLEGLGLLEAAKFDLYEQCRRDDDE